MFFSIIGTSPKKLMFGKLMVLALIVSGCFQTKSTGPEPSQDFTDTIPIDRTEECIPALETFAYPSKTDPAKPAPGKTLHILPSQWNYEKDFFPEISQSNMESLALQQDQAKYGHIELARTKDEHVELWLTSKPIGLFRPDEISLYQFWIYRPDSQTWNIIPAQVGDSGAVVDKLFVTQSGDIWGQNFWDSGGNTNSYPLMSKYNEEKNSFEFVQGTENIPASRKGSLTYPFWSEILLDENDTFWILVHNDAIYSFLIRTGEIQRRAEIPDINVAYPVMTNYGDILFQDRLGITTSNADQKLYVFSPQTGKIGPTYAMVEPWPFFTNIFYDHSGRMWIGNLGWRDPDGTWYTMQRPEIFITNSVHSGMEYRWRTPFIVMESSDGRLWFQSDNGMAWLDFEKEKWCWFTTYQSNIVEDSEHNCQHPKISTIW